MTNFYKTFARPALFSVDAERAHGLSLASLKAGLHPRVDRSVDGRLAISLAGIDFPNPLGMAAGYDKNAQVPNALAALGFGHVEVGTVTPLPQPGNAKPRVFRLVKDRGVINRLGFNSGGHAVALENLKKHEGDAIVGVNLGANKTSEDFAADYVAGITFFASVARYFTVNISSPNTPGLRGLQERDPLSDLVSRVADARDSAVENTGRTLPLFLKIAPDLEEGAMDDIARVVGASRFDGMIVSNTTLSRAGLRSSHRDQVGGLSGRPLFERSTIVLAKMAQRLGSAFPMIGVGGVENAATAFEKIRAGAHLVQLYTGLIYQGPVLPGDILRGLTELLDQEKLASIDKARGTATQEWAARQFDT